MARVGPQLELCNKASAGIVVVTRPFVPTAFHPFAALAGQRPKTFMGSGTTIEERSLIASACAARWPVFD
jgi:hypothetical protein